MTHADEPMSLVFFTESEVEYVAVADTLTDRSVVRVGDALAERGRVERDGKSFQVFVSDYSHGSQFAEKRVQLCSPAPRVFILVAIDAQHVLGRGMDEVSIKVRATTTELDRTAGPLFVERLRLAAKRGFVLLGEHADTATAFTLRDTMDAPERAVGDLVFLTCSGLARTTSAQGRIRCARLIVELLLRALALDIPEARPTTALSPVVGHVPPSVSGLAQNVLVYDTKNLADVRWPLVKGAGFHVVLGQNASGKTALLRAIATALLPHDELGALRQEWARWVRQGHETARCKVTFGDDVSAWRIVDKQIEKMGHAYAGFSAAYGPFRRFTGGDTEFVREFDAHRRLLRHLSLFSERVALSDALKWMQDLAFRKATGKPEGELLDAVITFVNATELLPRGAALSHVDPDGVWFRDANGVTLPVDELSDGYRAILSLTLDLLRHLAAEFGHASLLVARDDVWIVDAEGIVIIDEVDAHLHPTWQQRVGLWFKKHFPRVQFLVATHSAIVCQAADSVLLLPEPGTGEEARMLTATELDRLRFGDLIDAYGTGVFGEGVTRSAASREKFERLAALNTFELQRPLGPEELDEQRELRRVLPSTAFTTSDAPTP